MAYILAIDYGLRFIGLSIASLKLKIPVPLKEIDRKGLSDEALASEILRVASNHGPLSKILIGLPLHMDNKDSVISKAAKAFASCFSGKTDAAILFLDERLTSKMAHALLKEKEYSRSKRSSVINSVSATILLQNFLENQF